MTPSFGRSQEYKVAVANTQKYGAVSTTMKHVVRARANILVVKLKILE